MRNKFFQKLQETATTFISILNIYFIQKFQLSLCIITGSFFAIFYISKAQEDIRKTEENETKVFCYSYLGSVTILIINQILQVLIQYLSYFDVYNSKTDTIISISKKSGIIQLLNTTVVQFAVNMIQNDLDIWNNGGLVEDVTSLMMSNAILPALISFISFENIVQWVYQKRFERMSDEEKKKHTQNKVHQIFQLPQFNPAACFASAANTLLLASFYSWIIPLGLPFSILSLLLQMYVNRYKLLRRQSMPVPYGAELTLEMINFFFQFATFFFSLGCLTFELISFKSPHPCTIVSIIISGIYYLIPMKDLLKWLKVEDLNVSKISYQESQIAGNFKNDYDIKNRLLKDKIIQEKVDNIIKKLNNDTKKQMEYLKYFYPHPKNESKEKQP